MCAHEQRTVRPGQLVYRIACQPLCYTNYTARRRMVVDNDEPLPFRSQVDLTAMTDVRVHIQIGIIYRIDFLKTIMRPCKIALVGSKRNPPLAFGYRLHAHTTAKESRCWTHQWHRFTS